MGRMSGIKWERAARCAPVHNIISSDFPKYIPQPWKFMPRKRSLNSTDKEQLWQVAQEKKSRVEWLLSYEYQRMWLQERELWKKRMYPENTTVNVDIVKRYVLTFKANNPPPKAEKKKPFTMKKFQGIGSKTTNTRPAGDKAMRSGTDAKKKPAAK